MGGRQLMLSRDSFITIMLYSLLFITIMMLYRFLVLTGSSMTFSDLRINDFRCRHFSLLYLMMVVLFMISCLMDGLCLGLDQTLDQRFSQSCSHRLPTMFLFFMSAMQQRHQIVLYRLFNLLDHVLNRAELVRLVQKFGHVLRVV